MPAQLLQFRQLKRNSEWVPQVLVRWTHLSADDDSWEDLAELQTHYPLLYLGDKVPLNEWGYVIFPWQVTKKLGIVDQSNEVVEGLMGCPNVS